MRTSRSPGFGPTESGDDVLIGYDCEARTTEGCLVDSAAIREPLVGSDGERAIVQYIRWRKPQAEAGRRVYFRSVWLSRSDAIAQGYLTGRGDR